VLPSQAFVVVAALEQVAVVVTFAQVLELFLDVGAVGVIARGLAGKVGVASGTIPITFDRFGRDVDFDVEVFGDAVHDVAHQPQLVGHVQPHARADLYFVLPAQDLSVRAGDGQASHQALEHQRVRERTAERVLAAD